MSRAVSPAVVRADAIAAGFSPDVADLIARQVFAPPPKGERVRVANAKLSIHGVADRPYSDDELRTTLRAVGVKQPGSLAASIASAHWSRNRVDAEIRARLSHVTLGPAAQRDLQQAACAAALARVWASHPQRKDSTS